MKYKILFFLFLLSSFNIFSQSIVINEFLSSNSSTPDDEGNYYDWIEFYNNGDSLINLNNFYLSDDTSDIYKWKFPDISIEPDSFLLVLASGNDSQTLTKHWETIINRGDNWQYFVGTSEPPSDWNTIGFNTTSWQEGPSGFGYGDDDDATIISNTISVYIRKEFSIADIQNITEVLLHMDYDDGFVAYINGVEAARSNVAGIPPVYNQNASSNHEALIYNGNNPEKFTINNWNSILNEGDNVLAVQVHNVSAGSSDLSVIPFLTFGMLAEPENSNGFAEILNFPVSAVETNFKIDADGEYLILSDENGYEIDKIFTGFLPADISRGRYPDGADEWFYFNESTPGFKNSESYFEGIETQPEFSVEAGFYDSQISLTISSSNPSGKIYYTLDGSEPDESSQVYNNPLLINSTTVVKAKTFNENSIPGNTVTKTYFINESFTLPVISLSTDPPNLWDNETGIYVLGNSYESSIPNYGANFWEDWEKPIHIEFFEPTGELAFAQNAGVKVYGGWSRSHDQKSLSFFARSIYGKGSFDYRIFPDLPIDKFEAFIIRNSGNDWYYTYIRDAFMAILASEVNIDVQAYRPALIFINGEYWGLQNIREKINEHFIASHYNLNADNVNLLENNGSIINGDNENYISLLQFLNSNNLDNLENYEHVKNTIDVENFINYMICQIYYDNQDWPGNNIKFWNSDIDNLKWRWIMYDTDYSFGIYDRSSYINFTLDFATATNGPEWPNPPWSTLLLRKLLENNEFKSAFINRFADLNNSILKPEYISQKIDSIFNIIQPEMERHKNRWGQSYQNWLDEVDYLHTFAENRNDYIQSNFENKFNLSGMSSFEVLGNSEEGYVQINFLKINNFPQTVSYFNNIPIQISAVPAAGYKFSHWEGYDSSERILSVLPENISTITAVFLEDSTDNNSIVINEINYNSSDNFNSEDWVELYNNSDLTINLSGWIFKDDDDEHIFAIPEGTVLNPDSFIVLVRDSSLFTQVHPGCKNFIGNFNFGFDGGGELLRLYNDNLSLIDTVHYDDKNPWPEEPDGNGSTLSLINPNLDNSLAESWKASSQLGTPGKVNDIYVSAEKKNSSIPDNFSLEQNFPNPFNPVTTIQYTVSEKALISLEVFDILGNKIKTLVNEEKSPGIYSIIFNANKYSSGVYYYRLTAGSITQTKKMVLLK